MRSTDEFRDRLRDVLARSHLSMRGLSAALGRDPGYVAALFDPTRPSRARPTPEDLRRASDVTGIPFVELLEALWEIDLARLADELAGLGIHGEAARRLEVLTDDERATVLAFVDFLVDRHVRCRRRPREATQAQPSGGATGAR